MKLYALGTARQIVDEPTEAMMDMATPTIVAVYELFTRLAKRNESAT